MGFHYARDHDLAGFWGEVCELAHRVHREAALLPATPIADLEKTLNIGPTQRLFRKVSACHQDLEIPAQALHEQVFFVLEFRIQARFAHTCGLFKVLHTRLSEAMLPEACAGKNTSRTIDMHSATLWSGKRDGSPAMPENLPAVSLPRTARAHPVT